MAKMNGTSPAPSAALHSYKLRSTLRFRKQRVEKVYREGSRASLRLKGKKHVEAEGGDYPSLLDFHDTPILDQAEEKTASQAIVLGETVKKYIPDGIEVSTILENNYLVENVTQSKPLAAEEEQPSIAAQAKVFVGWEFPPDSPFPSTSSDFDWDGEVIFEGD